MKYQAYIKGKEYGQPKNEKQKEAIDRCISGVLWEVLK
jgi:hypothetical protein